MSLIRLVLFHGSFARYVKLRVAHVRGMPGTFSPPSRVSDPDMHHGTCVTHQIKSKLRVAHVRGMPGALTSGFLWSRWREKRSRHSRRMRNRWSRSFIERTESHFNTLRLRLNGRQFADDNLSWFVHILLTFVPKWPVNNIHTSGKDGLVPNIDKHLSRQI